MPKKQITIIGSGFAAMTAAKELRKRNNDVDVTIISPAKEFIYLPSLIWIPSGVRQPEQLRIPLDKFFRHNRVNHFKAEVIGLKDGGRTVITDQGEVKNDALIIASGGRFIKKLPGIKHAITPCEGIPAAIAIRDQLARMDGGTIAIGFGGNPNEPSAMRGGPMFEFLFGIDSQLRKESRRDKFKLIFFNPAPEPGKRLGEKAVKGLLNTMKARGIETHLGHKMVRFEADKVVTEGGEFAADMILFMPGMTGNAWFDNSELPRSPGGLVRADEFCRVEGMDRVYIAGDSGSFPGPDWMPKQAHMAALQASAAVINMLAEMDGKEVWKHFRVELMCIVDSLDKGMLIARTPKFNIVLPANIFWHWVKRLFEWWYLFQYR